MCTGPCTFCGCIESTFVPPAFSIVPVLRGVFSFPNPVPGDSAQNSTLTFSTDLSRVSCVPGSVSAAGDSVGSQSGQQAAEGNCSEGGCSRRCMCPPNHLSQTAMTTFDSFVLLFREKHITLRSCFASSALLQELDPDE